MKGRDEARKEGRMKGKMNKRKYQNVLLFPRYQR
jgi:hypothetical protein